MTMSSKKISKSLHSTLIAWGNAHTSNGLTACAVNEITQPSNAHWRTYVGSLREQKIPCPPSLKPSKPTPLLVKSWTSSAPSLANTWNPQCLNRGAGGGAPCRGVALTHLGDAISASHKILLIFRRRRRRVKERTQTCIG